MVIEECYCKKCSLTKDRCKCDLVDRKTAIKWFLDNPKGRLKMVYDSMGIYINAKVSINALAIYLENDKALFCLIPPVRKLREMSFGEMYYYWYTKIKISNKHCRNVITGETYERPNNRISKEEFMGNWTIEGYYEEEKEG